MASQHHARFTWGTGPQTVFVAGGFNNWSDTATPLEKQADGSFAADVPMPWGEKQAFKYVVDGEWKVREDEAKEWDAAGNMNNVYTAPHAPTSSLPAGGEPTSSTGGAGATAAAVPAATAPDTAPATTTEETEPSSLLASSAPPAASSGNPYVLGAVAGGSQPTPIGPSTVSATGAELAAKEKEDSVAPSAPTTTEPVPDQIEKTAATATIGDASTAEDKTLLERAAEYTAPAAAALGGILGGAAVAVEKATGIDLTHSQPLTVEEAKAKGIDVDALETKEAPADTTSPVGTKPSAAAIDDLDKKVQELKVDLPNGSASKEPYANAPVPIEETEKRGHDIPAQAETEDQHKHIPAPVITPVAPRDPAKDRTLNGSGTNSDTAGTKPIDSAPGVSAVAEKEKAEKNPGLTGSTPAAATGAVPSTTGPTSTSATQTVTDPGTSAKDAIAAGSTSADPSAKNITETPASAPAPVTKDATPVAPATPAKATATDSAASTPAKSSTHGKESTSGTTPKKKSGFMSKIKHAFSSPKEKK